MRVSLPSPADFLDSTNIELGARKFDIPRLLFKAPTELDGKRRTETTDLVSRQTGSRLSVASSCGASVSSVDVAANSIFFVPSTRRRRTPTKNDDQTTFSSERTVGPLGYSTASSGTGTRREPVFGWMWMVSFPYLCSSSLLVALSVSVTDDRWHFSAGGGRKSWDGTPTIVLSP